jgi:hypothetical protein
MRFTRAVLDDHGNDVHVRLTFEGGGCGRDVSLRTLRVDIGKLEFVRINRCGSARVARARHRHYEGAPNYRIEPAD